MNQNPQEATNSSNLEQTRPLRVMVIESSRITRKIIETVLGREECQVTVGKYRDSWGSNDYAPFRRKYDVFAYEDPIQALQKLLDPNHLVPDMLILRLSLPKVDGLQVLRRIRETPRLQLMPVIVIAQQDRMEDRIKATAAGASAFLARPLKEAMIRTTAVEIEQHLLLNTDIWAH